MLRYEKEILAGVRALTKDLGEAWVWIPNLDRLDMTRSSYHPDSPGAKGCLLAQLYGHYVEGKHHLHFDTSEASAHGFFIDTEYANAEHQVAAYNTLTEEWKIAIQLLRSLRQEVFAS